MRYPDVEMCSVQIATSLIICLQKILIVKHTEREKDKQKQK